MYKINYWHHIQLTLYKALHFSEGPMKNEEKKFMLNYKNISFALLDEWNVTETSFDHS
jgi:hypothetical protein